jgi:hypothetical protein
LVKGQIHSVLKIYSQKRLITGKKAQNDGNNFKNFCHGFFAIRELYAFALVNHPAAQS